MNTHDYSIWVVDTQVVACAIAHLLSEKLEISAQPVDYMRLPPGSCDLVLIEIYLPGACGLTLAAQLRSAGNMAVAVWGTQPVPLHAWVAWQVGLNSCLDKDAAWDELETVILTLTRGASLWPPRLWEQVQTFESEVGWRLHKLNETDWARWLDLVRGRPLKQLGAAWGLTPRGAAKAIERLCEKLQVADRSQAETLAWSSGLIQIMRHDLVWAPPVTLYRAPRSAVQTLAVNFAMH